MREGEEVCREVGSEREVCGRAVGSERVGPRDGGVHGSAWESEGVLLESGGG